MKKVLFSAALLGWSLLSTAQMDRSADRAQMRADADALYAKSKNQRLAGGILTWGGSATMLLGLLSMNTNSSEKAQTGGMVIALGLGATLAGIPLSIAGKRNRRKADELMRAAASAMYLPGQRRYVPAATLTVPIR